LHLFARFPEKKGLFISLEGVAGLGRQINPLHARVRQINPKAGQKQADAD
jgi:hypothetical protein